MQITYYEYEGGIKDTTPRTITLRGGWEPPERTCDECDEPYECQEACYCDCMEHYEDDRYERPDYQGE